MLSRTLAVTLLVLAVGLGGTPVQAARTHQAARSAYQPGFGQEARAVARTIGCTRRRLHSGPSDHIHSGLVCRLRGKRVNVLTFADAAQQRRWVADFPYAVAPGRRGWFGLRTGTVVVAKNLNRPAARVGARALGGAVRSARSPY